MADHNRMMQQVSFGRAIGTGRAKQAALRAVDAPLPRLSTDLAMHVHVSAGDDLTLDELYEAVEIVTDAWKDRTESITAGCSTDQPQPGELEVRVFEEVRPSEPRTT